MHDIWAITGFSNNSATLKNPNKKKFLLYLWDNTANLLKSKKKIYNKSKLHIVAVSEWIKKEIKKSILCNQSVTRIYNGIDIDIFRPQNKTLIRKELGLPQNKKIVGFGIKGWENSNKIIEKYKNNNNIFFTAVGHSVINTTNKNCLSLPSTQNRALFAKYLSCADIFLNPTIEDSFGLINAESMACGTPVVTHEIDAIPEITKHKKTGYVSKHNDVNDLKNGVDYILNLSKDDYNNMSKNARSKIVNNFSNEKMYNEYLELYQKLINK